MLINHYRNHIFNLYIIISFSVLCLLVSNVKCHKCFVCGLDNDLPHCDNFDPSSEIYTKDCPSGTRSCGLQQKDGKVFRRSCEDIKISDCQQANDVLYCYCFTNFCNLNERNLNQKLNNDDEDIAEGSGFTRKTEIKDTGPPSTTEMTKQVNFGNRLRSSLTVFIALVLLH